MTRIHAATSIVRFCSIWPWGGGPRGASKYDVRIGRGFIKGGCVNFVVKSVPNADMGEGGKKSKTFAVVISGCSLVLPAKSHALVHEFAQSLLQG